MTKTTIMPKVIVTIVQAGISFLLLTSAYMIFAIQDSEFGFDGLFALLLQLGFAIILSALTLLGCAIIGLPIRLNKKIRAWWIKHFYISLIGVFIGIAFLALSFLPQFMETVQAEINGSPGMKKVPNFTLAGIGWFLTGFMALHIFPPKFPGEN
jgi:hypothetical protein